MGDMLEKVNGCLKSILTTHGGEMHIRQLTADYDMLVGKEIPYKQLSFSSLGSFLRSIPSVHVYECQGGQYVSLVSGNDKGLDTIKRMVQEQNTKRTKRSVANRRARPYLGRGGVSSRGSTRGHHPRFSSNRQVFRPPGTSLRSPHFPQMDMPNVRQQNYPSQAGNPAFKSNFNQFGNSILKPNPTQTIKPTKSNLSKTGNPTIKPNTRPLLQQAGTAKSMNQPNVGHSNKKVPSKSTSIHPTLGSKTSPLNVAWRQPSFGFNKPSDNKVSMKQSANEFRLVDIQNNVVNHPHPTFGFNQANLQITSIPQPQPLLKVAHPRPLLPTSTTPQPPRATPVQPKPLEVRSETITQNTVGTTKMKCEDMKTKLEGIVQRKYPNEKPVFCTMTWGKKNRHWLATVQIGKLYVSSYPDELGTSDAAVQRVAMNALKILEEQAEQSLPVTSSPDLYIPRVRELVENAVGERAQVWLSKVEELYQEAHKEQLPEGWVQEAVRRADAIGLVVEKPCGDRYTLQIASPPTTPIPPTNQEMDNEREVSQPLSEQGYTADDTSSRDGSGYNSDHSSLEPEEVLESDSRFPPLKYPQGPYWDVFIMYIEDLNCIFLRLVGEEYSTAYDDLLTELELHYMEEKNLSPVKSPVIGDIYAAKHDESWFRVKLQEIQGKEVTVLFVDHGDTETIELSDMHHLLDRFFSLPAQCVRCCLSGLEYARSDPSALALLQDLALGQTLVAQVVGGSRGAGQERRVVQPLILYNTAGDDDVNINDKIARHLVENFPDPCLPPVGGVAEVYLMHISSSGDIFVQVESNTFQLLYNLLQLARNRAEEMMGESMQIDLTRLYLARFSEDGEWYRAAPKGNIDPNGKVPMYFVDFGNLDLVPLSSVRPLAAEGDQLNLIKVPHQALQCRLHGVPGNQELQWTHRTSQRLTELTPDTSPMLLKVQEAGDNSGPPQVELFKRLQPQNELVSLNATLSLDKTLFSNEGDRNNNSVKDVVLSPSRSCSRQSSSASQGFSTGPSSLNSSPSSLPSSPRCDASQASHCPPSQVVPSVGEYYDVVVTYAANPSNFAVQSWKMSNKLAKMGEDMQTFYETAVVSKAPTTVTVGGYYAVKHNDGTWYRAHVNNVQQDIVTGLFIDYGDCFVTSCDHVRPLDPSFCLLSCQAIKAKLHGIEPANKDWTTDDIWRFQGMVEYREFVSAVIGREEAEDGMTQLSLILVDTGDDKSDVYISQILLDEGRAVKKS